MSDCTLTLLPTDYCGHCSRVEVVAEEDFWLKLDRDGVPERDEFGNFIKVHQGEYVETLNDRPRQSIPQAEQFTDHVDYKDIYGEQTALRLKRRK